MGHRSSGEEAGTQLKAHGTSAEVTVNSLKTKSQGDSYPVSGAMQEGRTQMQTSKGNKIY